MTDRRTPGRGPGDPPGPDDPGEAGGPGDSTFPDDPGTGTPIRSLEFLELPTSAEFSSRVRSRINRRILSSQGLDFACRSLPGVFRTYLELLIDSMATGTKKGSPPSERNDP